MIVFVPTRARIFKQITRSKFYLDKIPYEVFYVVPDSEADKYLANWPGSNIYLVPDSYRLSDIRQWIVDTWSNLDPHHVCMDDDLVLLRRHAPTDIRQRSNMSVQDATDCFKRMEEWLQKGIVHGSLSQRGGNNHCPEAYKLIGRSTDCHFYNAQVIVEEGVRFDDVILRQDFHMTLNLLERGYPNLIDHEFMSGQKDGEPGGCQIYRTHEMLEQQAYRLAELHPGLVKIVEKERIGGFGTSVDVRVSWQKAFNAKLSERKRPLED